MKRLRTIAVGLFAFLGVVCAQTSAVALSPGTRTVLFSAACPSSAVVPGSVGCPSASLNFQSQQYWVPGSGFVPFSSVISLTRASNEVCAYSNGKLISVGSNVPCITDQGWQIMEARTNKCTNYNANPPALVTPTTAAAFNAAVTNMTANAAAGSPLFGVVDDSTKLSAAIGSTVVNGRVYKIDSTAGTGTSNVVISGPTGNTNAHSFSIYVRVDSGTATVLTTTGAGSQSTSSTSYVRITSANFTPGGINDRIQINSPAGSVIYFILNDLEEGSFATPPIVVAGASAARAADVAQAIGPLATAALSAKSAFFKTKGMTNTAGSRLLEYSGGFINYFSSTTIAKTFFSGANKATATFGSGNTTGTSKVAIGFDAIGTSIIANGGTKGTDANAIAQQTGTVTIGNNGVGAFALNGLMQQLNLGAVKVQFDNSTSP